MPELREQFETAAQAVKTLARRPDNDTLLRLYGLYKQALEGDSHGERPSSVDFVEAAKFDAWSEHTGLGSDAAMQAYIDTVAALMAPS